MAGVGSHHHQRVLCQTSDKESLDDGCVVDVDNNNNKERDGDMADDAHGDDSTASLAWPSTCSYDADCERSNSKNDFHARESRGEYHRHRHHGGGRDGHHLVGIESSSPHAVHVPAHVQDVLMTNPWLSSLPSSPATTTLTDAKAHSATKARANSACRRRLFRRHCQRRRQGGVAVGGGGNNSNKHHGLIVCCRNLSSSWSLSSSLSSSSSDSSSSSSPSFSASQKKDEEEDEEEEEEKKEEEKDDDTTFRLEDLFPSTATTWPSTIAFVAEHGHFDWWSMGVNHDLDDDSTTNSLSGVDDIANSLGVALAEFLSIFKRPTSTTATDASDEEEDGDDEDYSTFIMDDNGDDESEEHQVERRHENVVVLASRLAIEELTESSGDCSAQSFPFDEEEEDNRNATGGGEKQDNDIFQTSTILTATLVDHCYGMQAKPSSNQNGVQHPVCSTEDGNSVNLIKSSITKQGEHPALVVNTIDSESSWSKSPIMRSSRQGEMSAVGGRTSEVGMSGDIWSGAGSLGGSLFSWVSTCILETPENDSLQDEDDHSADNSVPREVAEAVLAEMDD